MVTELLKFEELSIERLYEVLKLRVDVFVVEQNCAYPELDAFDQYAMHLLFIEQDEVIAYSEFSHLVKCTGNVLLGELS